MRAYFDSQFRDMAHMAGKVWRRECEAVDHTVTTVRKQRGTLWLSEVSFYSVLDLSS